MSCALFLGAVLWPLAMYQIKGGNEGEGRTQFFGESIADKVTQLNSSATHSKLDTPLPAVEEEGR